jgi:hypothetical protein
MDIRTQLSFGIEPAASTKRVRASANTPATFVAAQAPVLVTRRYPVAEVRLRQGDATGELPVDDARKLVSFAAVVSSDGRNTSGIVGSCCHRRVV